MSNAHDNKNLDKAGNKTHLKHFRLILVTEQYSSSKKKHPYNIYSYLIKSLILNEFSFEILVKHIKLLLFE